MGYLPAGDPSQTIRQSPHRSPANLAAKALANRPTVRRACLMPPNPGALGDAAHAMLPTIGQGAATALEDGVCVGRMIASPVSAGGDLAEALAAFDQARRPRCRQLARQAILLARAGFELGDGWRQPVRNTLLRLIPAGPTIKAGARITHWTPPE